MLKDTLDKCAVVQLKDQSFLVMILWGPWSRLKIFLTFAADDMLWELMEQQGEVKAEVTFIH